MILNKIKEQFNITNIPNNELDIIRIQRECDDIKAVYYWVWFKCGSILNELGEEYTDLLSFIDIKQKQNKNGYYYSMEDDDYNHLMEYMTNIMTNISNENKCYFHFLNSLMINSLVK